jgi:hypothetical protein
MNIDAMETLLRIYLDNPSTNSLTSARAFTIINNSYFQLYNMIIRNNQNFFAATQNITFVADTERYTPGTAMSRLLLVERIDQTHEYEVPHIPYTHRSRYLVVSGGTESGYASKYYIFENKIGIVPIPTAAVTNALRLTYVPNPTLLTTGVSPPTEWPTDLHEVIVLGALLRVGIRDREERKLRQDMYNELKLALLEATAMRQSQELKTFEEADGNQGDV